MDTTMSGTEPMANKNSTAQFMSITGKPLPGLSKAHIVLGQCRDIDDYEKLNRLGEGTYGVVHRSRDRKTDQIVALKQIVVFEKDRGNGIPITTLREISILKMLRHKNVISVLDVAVGRSSPAMDDIYMVMEYAEQDLANLLDHARVKFSESEVKCLMKQLLHGIQYLHQREIIHRDIKMSNLLLTRDGVLKLADFGLAREWSPRPLTPGVVTVWYRAPELLLSASRYTSAVDVWAAGCIMGELILCAPLLPGDTELQQWTLISSLLGAPTERIWPRMYSYPGLPDTRSLPPPRQTENQLARRLAGSKRECINLVNELLTYNPDVRPKASKALRHPYFTRESPQACVPEMIQTFPEIRNAANGGAGNYKGAGRATQHDGGGSGAGGYVFDFGDEISAVNHGRKKRKR